MSRQPSCRFDSVLAQAVQYALRLRLELVCHPDDRVGTLRLRRIVSEALHQRQMMGVAPDRDQWGDVRCLAGGDVGCTEVARIRQQHLRLAQWPGQRPPHVDHRCDLALVVAVLCHRRARDQHCLDIHRRLRVVALLEAATGHRPPLMGIVPGNTGGFGAADTAAEVFGRNEIESLQRRFAQLNDWLDDEAVRFTPYSIKPPAATTG